MDGLAAMFDGEHGKQIGDALNDAARTPATCTLDPMLKFAVMMTEPDPCAGCNEDRAKCGGRPRGDRHRPIPR